MVKKVIFTIAAINYFAQALTLFDSFTLSRTDSIFYIILIDNPKKPYVFKSNIQSSGLNIIYASDILKEQDVPYFHLAFKYSVVEFCTSIKATVFKYFFKKNFSKVIYLDPDIYIYHSLDFLFHKLDYKDFLLTPHLTNFSFNSIYENEAQKMGIFNLGFLGLSNSSKSYNFLNWWEEKLINRCYINFDLGLFVDQKWIDFLPSLENNNIDILLNPGINLARWNLHERELFLSNNVINVKNKINKEFSPLIFFHFSSFKILNNSPILLNYKTDNEIQRSLYFNYANKLIQNFYSEYSILDYPFNYFSNDIMIHQFHRDLYSKFYYKYEKDPFEVNSKGSYYFFLKTQRLVKRKYSNKQINYKIKYSKFMIFINRLLFKFLGYESFYKLLLFSKKISKNDYIEILIKK